MAATRKDMAVGPIVKAVSFDVTADNDVLFAANEGPGVILAIIPTGLVTALNSAAGVDVALPFVPVADETVCVTTTGAGTVQVIYCDQPDEGYSTFDT